MKNISKILITVLAVVSIISIFFAFVFFFKYNEVYSVNKKLKIYSQVKIDNVNEKIKVFYAKEFIESNTQLTAEIIGTVEIDSSLLKNFPNIVRSVSQITDAEGELFYVDFDSSIPKGSFLYTDVLISKSKKADSKLETVPDGYRYFSLEVDLKSTLGNVIYPGASIDIYAYIKNNDVTEFGKLYNNINVVDVIDSNWNTTTGDITKESELLILLVTEDDYRFLEKAKRISGLELIPAPNNEPYEDTYGGTKVDSLELKRIIESYYN